MFYDTGIGKEGYSIIGQGQIDKILERKTGRGRELFDEAGGNCKIQAPQNGFPCKKLEDEQNSLTRVRLVFSELEKQIGPLEKAVCSGQKEYWRRRKSWRFMIFICFSFGDRAFKGSHLGSGRKVRLLDEMEAAKRVAWRNKRTEYQLWRHRWEEIDVAIEKSKEPAEWDNAFEAAAGRTDQCFKEQINTARINEEHYGIAAVRSSRSGMPEGAESRICKGQRSDPRTAGGISNQDTDAKQLIQVQSQIAVETMRSSRVKKRLCGFE